MGRQASPSLRCEARSTRLTFRNRPHQLRLGLRNVQLDGEATMADPTLMIDQDQSSML